MIEIFIMMYINNTIDNEKLNISSKQEKANFIYGENNKITSVQKGKEEYQNMPDNLEGYKVIGKLEIKSIKLSTYILEETIPETLNISVTKLTGPRNKRNRQLMYNRS